MLSLFAKNAECVLCRGERSFQQGVSSRYLSRADNQTLPAVEDSLHSPSNDKEPMSIKTKGYLL
jgi:hypothetical protein